MGFSAIRATVPLTLRQHWAVAALIAVVISLLLGSAFGALAGARRSATALDRFLDRYGAEDVFLVYPEDGSLDPSAVHALPQVRRAEYQSYLGMVPVDDGGRALVEEAGSINPYLYVSLMSTASRLHIVKGRDLDPDEPLEVVIDPELAAERGLDVGSHLRMASYAASQEEEAFSQEPGADIPTPRGPVVDLEVVGITRMPVDIHPDEEEHTTSFGGTKDIYLTPALYERYGEEMLVYLPPIPGGPEAIQLVDGAESVEAFRRAVRELPGGEGAQIDVSDSDTLDSARNARRAIGVETAVLYALAAVLAASGAVLIGFAMVGVARTQTGELQILRGMGLRPHELLLVAAAPSIVATIVGAAGAVAVAVVMSARMPIGLARQAEASPGVDVDLAVLVPGATLLLVLGLAGALLAARATATSLVVTESPATGSGIFADRLARAGAPVSATVGARLNGRSGGAARSAPVRSAIVGSIVAMTAIAGVATYTATLSHLAGSMREQGAGWDLALGNINLSDYGPDDMARLAAVRGISGVSGSAAPQGRAYVNGLDVAIAGLEQFSGSVGPTMVSGRLPTDKGEVVLGRRTAARLRVDEGDVVEVRAGFGDARAHVRVVGTALLNSNLAPTMQLGEGAIVSVDQLRELVPDARVTFLVASVEDGADVDAVIASVQQTWGDNTNPERPLLSGDVVNLRRVGHLPVALAAGLGAAAVVLVVFALTLSRRQRRVDLAVVRALGATQRQAAAALTWQGIWMAAGVALVGAPAGVLIGRAVWTYLADDLGAITLPVVPWVRVLEAAAGAVALAAFVATVPAVREARRPVATALRVE